MLTHSVAYRRCVLPTLYRAVEFLRTQSVEALKKRVSCRHLKFNLTIVRSAEKMLGNMRLTGNIPCIPARIRNIPLQTRRNTSTANNGNGKCTGDIVSNDEQRVVEYSVESNVRTSITSNVPLEYELAFHKAMATFKHQTIFDLETRKVSYSMFLLCYQCVLCCAVLCCAVM